MRIAFVSTMDVAPWGGSELLWVEAAHEALRAGHEVFASVVGWPETPPPLAALAAAGAVVAPRTTLARRARPLVRRALYRLWPPLVFRPRAHWRGLLDFRPDVVCVSQGSAYDAVRHREGLDETLLGLGLPYVVVCHSNAEADALDDAERAAARRFFLGARRVAFVAERTRALSERQLAVRLPHATILRNPVHLADRSPVPWPEGGEARLAAVGRIEIAKGIDVLIETLGAPPWPARPWRLRLYGDCAEPAFFRELAALCGIGDRVEFCGHQADVRRIWAENHLLVLPSRQESAPLAVVEAMFCGRPVVATDVGGVREWVEEGQTGFVAEAPMPFYLGAALERAWQRRGDWPQLGRQGHDKAAVQAGDHPGRVLLGALTGNGARACPMA